MINRPECSCFDQYDLVPKAEVFFHSEEQDTTCDAWNTLLQLIEDAAKDKREVFAPFKEMSLEERSEIITLPPSIGKLTSVKHLLLYRSFLVRIPPEIGEMTSLEEFTPYTSHRLHWFPYEITRCTKLKRSTVSTRSLYGNFKLRPPFPRLKQEKVLENVSDLTKLHSGVWGATSSTTCSVCNRTLNTTGCYQRWISLLVATDVLPLLVNACSEECIQKLPPPPEGYVQKPHTGGLEIKQPRADYDFGDEEQE